MKKILFLLLMLLIFYGTGKAQDLIIKRNGEEIKSKIIEITTADIKYKLFDYQQGPDVVLPKSDIFMIRFGNGIKQVFNETPTQIPKNAEVAPDQPADLLAPPVLQLEGPRIGATLLGPGKWATKLEEKYSARPFISQFGWQFENRLFTTGGGTVGLIEWVPLIGGLDQGLFLPSISALVGLRNKAGLECGFGPNVSVAGAGLALAAGYNFHTDYVNLPVNVALVPSRHGARFSILTGFNIRKR